MGTVPPRSFSRTKLFLVAGSIFRQDPLDPLLCGDHPIYGCFVANIFWLVVWNMNFIFPYIGNFIIPTDELIFFREVGIPPTSLELFGAWAIFTSVTFRTDQSYLGRGTFVASMDLSRSARRISLLWTWNPMTDPWCWHIC